MNISSQQSLLQILLLPGEEQTIVAGERLVAPLALLPTVLLLLLVELSSGLVFSLLSEGGDGHVTRWAPGKVKLLGHDFLCTPVS